MTDPASVVFAIAISLGWCAFALAWVLRRSEILSCVYRVWRASSVFSRIVVIAALIEISVYGGSKSGGTNIHGGGSTFLIPRPIASQEQSEREQQSIVVSDDSANGLHFTEFTINGNRFDFSAAWPQTNIAAYSAIDVFHKECLGDPSWRWICRKAVLPEDGETKFSIFGQDLPYWEESVTRRFGVYTNEVAAPFGARFTNVYVRASEVSEPRSAFFMLANQRDTDHDGLSDAVERSLGFDSLDPDMDNDGLPDGQELALGTSPFVQDSDEDGLPDGDEVSWGKSFQNGAFMWIDTSEATAITNLPVSFDDDSITLEMPIQYSLFGQSATNLTVSANGLVGISTCEPAFDEGSYSNSREYSIPTSSSPSATIAAFWDDLRAKQSFDSSISVFVLGSGNDRIAVIEYYRSGFYNGGENDIVSFQVQFFERETNSVHVVFSEATGLGTGLSATVGARAFRDNGVLYSYNEAESVSSGLHIEFHFGQGTNPAKADSDGDGLNDPTELTIGTDPNEYDMDCDDLSDGQEIALGTSPFLFDTDGDGLDDKWEIEHPPFDPLDPADGYADDDGDGLSNAFEITYSRTDWKLADTDGDGLSDFVEWNGSTDPRNSDTDGDGLGDGEELALGTDPCNYDSDGDELPDGWEIRYGCDALDPTDLDLYADPDGDGLSNVKEAELGSNPFTSDTDDDGLADGEEYGFASVISLNPFDLYGATNIIDRFENLDTSSISISLPFALHPPCAATCSNVIISIDGILALATPDNSLPRTSLSNDGPVVIKAFYDNLLANTNELASAISTASFGTNGTRYFIIEYRDFGFCDVEPSATNSVSFQVVFSENEPATVRVIYFRDNQQGEQLSDRALGSNAEISVMSEFCNIAYSSFELLAVPGFCIEFHLGTGTSPLLADTDGDGFTDAWEVFWGFNPHNSMEPSPYVDSDNDGILDFDEISIGTDPFKPDTDGDGMQDGWEIAYGLNPLIGDSDVDVDNDGLSNGEEYLFGSNPNLEDSDGDGLLDSEEASFGTNPQQPDTDGDGMADKWEIDNGFDPNIDNDLTNRTDDDFNSDPDGDGITNGVECTYGANPFNTDTDGDGISDGAEVDQGTDPCDATDEGNTANVVRVMFKFGDESGSMSEKYRLDIRPVASTGSIPKSYSFINQRYDGADSVVIPLSPGYEYEVSFRHISTNPEYRHYPVPDYDYCLRMTSLETPANVILVDDDGIFGSMMDADYMFKTPPKTARILVPKPTIAISKSSLDGWDEMEVGEVILSDEEMKIDISVVPAVPSLAAMKEALGSEYTIITATKPDGASVPFIATDQFIQTGTSSELRITKTRADLKTLGLLPVNEEDGINEMAWVDTADLVSPNSVQNLEDSDAFSNIGYEFRGKATDDAGKSLGSNPPNSECTISFFKAAGCEIVTVEYGGATSNRRQIMNQADYFYFSGHGGHFDGKVNGGKSGNRWGAQDVVRYWANDLKCVIIAGCSVLDINDYNDNYDEASHFSSPGKAWEETGPALFLGYNYIAPGDKGGAPKRIVEGWLASRNTLGDVNAWMKANADNHAWNACAIESGTRYIYFKKFLWIFHVKTIVKKEVW